MDVPPQRGEGHRGRTHQASVGHAEPRKATWGQQQNEDQQCHHTSFTAGLRGVQGFPLSLCRDTDRHVPAPLACVRITGLPAAELPATLPRVERRTRIRAQRGNARVKSPTTGKDLMDQQSASEATNSLPTKAPLVRGIMSEENRLTWRPQEVWRRGGCCRPRNPLPRQ